MSKLSHANAATIKSERTRLQACLNRVDTFFPLQCSGMRKLFGAIYENGVLRPLEPLPLAEHQQVSLAIAEIGISTDDAGLLDEEFLDGLADEQLLDVSHEEVREALATIPGSMTEAFAAEREERF
jgi:predicted DNA-binding antitoxin AbrB/MazE fold protein